VQKAYKGEHIENDEVIRIAKLFRDELTLPNMGRPQLVSMCKYMQLPIYGSDDFLRFQLRAKFRAIKEDDRRILWEGIDSLNTIELREACKEKEEIFFVF
jgi:LETM1 and EF-hand domain-containing protein 1